MKIYLHDAKMEYVNGEEVDVDIEGGVAVRLEEDRADTDINMIIEMMRRGCLYIYSQPMDDADREV